MLKKHFEELKGELLFLGIALFGLLIALKIAFYKESIIVIVKMVASLFWLFVIPGYALMLYWKEKLDFLERLVIGCALLFAVMGILSYYVGIFGLHIKYHVWVFPPLIIGLGIYFWARE